MGYTNVDYESNLDKRRSTSRYVFMFINGAISQISRLQDCMAMLTIESKYIIVFEAFKEAIWLASLVRALGILVEMPIL